MGEKKEPTVIENPPKSWWAGDERVEKYMPKVADAIKRYVKWPSASFSDIYNRAYEAVFQVIKEYESKIDWAREVEKTFDKLETEKEVFRKKCEELEAMNEKLKEMVVDRMENQPVVILPDNSKVKFSTKAGEELEGIYTGRLFVAYGLGHCYLPDEVECWVVSE